MWWTQPKLALIALGINGVLHGAFLIAVADADYRVAAIVSAQILLLAAYWRISRRFGERHLAGQTEPAFDRNLWNKDWKPSVDQCLVPDGRIPRPEGGSFYKQVAGDTREARDALYQAIAVWEGTRLFWWGGLLGLSIALTTSLLPLLLWPADRPSFLALGFGVVLSVWAVVLPESFNILLLRRHVLRLGIVERAATLVPRSAVDLGLEMENDDPHASRWEGILIFGVAWGAPLVIIVTLTAGLRGLALATVMGSIGAFVIVRLRRAYRRMLVSGIPFLRLSRVPEVNVMLDLMHRQRAYLSVHPLVPFLSSLMVLIDPRGYFFFGPVVVFEIGYIVAITFGDQLSAYAGFTTATYFEDCFRRSMRKVEAASS